MRQQSYVYERSIPIHASSEAVYRFHLDPSNIALISPPGVKVRRFQIDGPIQVGTRMTLTLEILALRREVWEVRIAEVIPGARLVDVALQSPFTSWTHIHTFEALSDSRTLLIDRVEYCPPFGRLGRWLNPIVYRPQLALLFWWRHGCTRALLEKASLKGINREH